MSRPRHIPARGEGLIFDHRRSAWLVSGRVRGSARLPALHARRFPLTRHDHRPLLHRSCGKRGAYVAHPYSLSPELTTAPTAAHAGTVFDERMRALRWVGSKFRITSSLRGGGYWRPHPRNALAIVFRLCAAGRMVPKPGRLLRNGTRDGRQFAKAMPSLPSTSEISQREAGGSRSMLSCWSIGAAFKVYIRTTGVEARAYSARVKVWWPAWFRIRDMWGDVAPDTITFEMMSRWRAALEKRHGRGVAHKTLRVWRTFWKIMLGMKVARTADPSTGVRNRAPAPRWQRWSEGEAVQLVKSAWRRRYHGLACIIAVASGDTQFSPVDTLRTLAARHRSMIGGKLVFDRQADGRAKTGRAAIGTVSARTERLVATYLAQLALDLHPDAILFRNRSGNPYRPDTLSDDFADCTRADICGR